MSKTLTQRSMLVRCTAVLLIAMLGLPPAALARYQPSHGFDLVTSDEEVQLGKQAAAETNKSMPLLSDQDPITLYVQRLGAKLAANAPGEKWPYNFHVVRQKEINAFALPGGPIYVNLGTIQAADNESELAGVMAHEISHVVQRHSTRAYTKQQEVEMPLALLGGFLGNGLGGKLASVAAQFGVGSYFLHNSRQSEKEADLLGTGIMYDSGYDPHALAQFFTKLQTPGTHAAQMINQFLSDHPDPGNRVAYVSQEVNTLPSKKYYAGSADFSGIKRAALGAKAYTAQEIAQMQKPAAVTGTGSAPASDSTPSSAMQTFEHSQYQMSYPENWKVFGDANSAVTIAPPSGVTQDAVVYGAIVSGFQPEHSGSLDEATHDLIASLRQSNPGMKVIGNDEDIRVNGVAAKSAELVGASPIKDATGKAQSERDWLITLPARDNSHILYVVFIAPDSNANQLRPTFENMLRSLKMK